MSVRLWCIAAWHLKDRDNRIRRDTVTRSQRLKFIVQLCSFPVVKSTRRPNLDSQCLGLALRVLCAAWSYEHGYRPLITESFNDLENHAGTVYKVTNWTCAGDTKEFPKNHTAY